MTLQGAIITLSLFLPPIATFVVLRRVGRTWKNAVVAALYIYAVCMIVLFGVIILAEGFGIFGESVGFGYPFILAICLWWLYALDWKEILRRQIERMQDEERW
jgi:hypothetical protein